MVDVENFIAPRSLTLAPLPKGEGDPKGRVREDWLAAISEEEPEQVVQELSTFRVNARRWLEAVTLPIDQLVLTLAQDVFTQPADLALSHKLALVLRQVADDHPEWRLPELTAELAVIAKNERRFIGFSSDDSGFDPDRHRGKVVVTTMHKAKGLEWDRVYLMSVNNYDFPSNMPNDRFISEKWLVRAGGDAERGVLKNGVTARAHLDVVELQADADLRLVDLARTLARGCRVVFERAQRLEQTQRE